MAVSVTPIRDTKWLTLEVCREFQRGTCSRPDTECKFAHPAKSCQVENGRVIACFDSLKVSNDFALLQMVLVEGGGWAVAWWGCDVWGGWVGASMGSCGVSLQSGTSMSCASQR